MSWINHALEELLFQIDHAQALKSAILNLSQQIYVERLVIEAALSSARQTVDLDNDLTAKGPAYRAFFEESHARVTALLADHEETEGTEIEPQPLPDFENIDPHEDPEVQRNINLCIEELRDERQVFLSGVRALLAVEPALLHHFRSRLRKLNGERYWTALDPHALLKDMVLIAWLSTPESPRVSRRLFPLRG